VYVLEGEPMFIAGDKELTATPGWWLRIPPGVRHAVAAPGPVRLLELHTPSCGFGAFLRGDEAAFDQEP
jgi:mannose-6-phosphate isomerase-like protein (cupin superfamily)